MGRTDMNTGSLKDDTEQSSAALDTHIQSLRLLPTCHRKLGKALGERENSTGIEPPRGICPDRKWKETFSQSKMLCAWISEVHSRSESPPQRSHTVSLLTGLCVCAKSPPLPPAGQLPDYLALDARTLFYIFPSGLLPFVHASGGHGMQEVLRMSCYGIDR